MARGIQRFTDYSSFGNHTGRGSGGGGMFLKGWKKDKEIVVWLHMVHMPIATWRHSIPNIVEMADRDNPRAKKTKKVWSKNLVCHEEVEVLEEQYFREDDGTRKKPPERCLVCKLAEWSRQQCLAFEKTRKKEVHKGIELITPAFKYRGDEETKILRMGGLTNFFGWKDLPVAAKKATKEAKIKFQGQTGVWNQNIMAKQNYAIYVVPANNVKDGVKLAVEAGSLGDKIKAELKKLYESGTDPTKTPICMKWKYDETETNLNEKYSVALMLDNGSLRKADARLVKMLRGPVPELPDDVTKPFNQKAVRMSLEKHCILPAGTVPWDTLAPTDAQIAKWAKEDAAKADEESEEDEGDDTKADADDDFVCECGAKMDPAVEKCASCGQPYEVDGDDKPAPKGDDADDDAEDEDDADDEDDESDDADEDDEDEDDEEEDADDDEDDEPEEKPAPKKSTAAAGAGGSKKKAPVPDSDDDVPFIRDMTFGEGV